MTIPNWHEEPISRAHDRDAFDCGDTVLNTFLRSHARKSHVQGGAKTFLAVADAGSKHILGFYSISPASIAFNRTPELIRHGLACHEVPVQACKAGRGSFDTRMPIIDILFANKIFTFHNI